jgi:hypothetical protein
LSVPLAVDPLRRNGKTFNPICRGMQIKSKKLLPEGNSFLKRTGPAKPDQRHKNFINPAELTP